MATRRGLQGTRPPRSSRRSIAGRRRIRCRGSRPPGASYPWRVRLFRRNLTEWEVGHGPMRVPRRLHPLDSGFRRNDEGGHGPKIVLSLIPRHCLRPTPRRRGAPRTSITRGAPHSWWRGSGRLLAPVHLPGQIEQLLEVLVVQPTAADENVGQRPIDLEADPFPLVAVGPGVAGRTVAEQAPRCAVLRPQVGSASPGTRLARVRIGRGVVGMELLALVTV